MAGLLKSLGKKITSKIGEKVTATPVQNITATPIAPVQNITAAPPREGTSFGKKILKGLVIASFVLILIFLILILIPIIPFWVITYCSFWGEYGFLRLIITKYRNF